MFPKFKMVNNENDLLTPVLDEIDLLEEK